MARWSKAILLALGALASMASAEPFFYLVRQWPTTACEMYHCQDPPQGLGFSIHGLWPNNDDGTFPSFCSRKKFRRSDLGELIDDMNKYWPSVKGSNEVFWTHEWEKHGTCAGPQLPTEHEYFAAALQLHKTLNIEDGLSAANIVPSNNAAYDTADLVAALKDSLGFAPIITCHNGSLEEVWFCINEDLDVEDCDQACTAPACHNQHTCPRVRYPEPKQTALTAAA
ncbi:hypothetical protein WJX72_001609 [[Myrmecia] bisecta]|uniref:Uncharacterized protein n=1 Tax=[Myrmecia] bisecta TaxID=41462 RepID=A0AAW1QE84_9CHLO